MTYYEFVEFFLAPCVVATVVAAVLRARHRPRVEYFPVARAVMCLAGVAVFAVVYTTPWDSWLIHNKVWWYPPGSVLGTLFAVPFEEYIFMVGITVATGCWTLVIAMGRSQQGHTIARQTPRTVVMCLWLAVIGLGGFLSSISPKWLYLGSMMVWFGVPLALQAGFGADLLRSARRLRMAGLALTPGWWIADAVAIHAGAWQLSWVHTIGVRVAGLPVEEAVFFLLVNLLVVNTIVLVTHSGLAHKIRRYGYTLRSAVSYVNPARIYERKA